MHYAFWLWKFVLRINYTMTGWWRKTDVNDASSNYKMLQKIYICDVFHRKLRFNAITSLPERVFASQKNLQNL